MNRRSISIEIDDADDKDNKKIRKDVIQLLGNFTDESNKGRNEGSAVKHHSPNDQSGESSNEGQETKSNEQSPDNDQEVKVDMGKISDKFFNLPF